MRIYFNETFRNILFTLLLSGSGYFVSNAFGILVTINKLNDKYAIQRSCYKYESRGCNYRVSGDD